MPPSHHREFDPEERYQLSPIEQAVLSVMLHAVLKTVYGADVSRA